MSSVAEPSSGVKINGSHTRLLYWCHGVDGRFVSLDTRGGALTCCLNSALSLLQPTKKPGFKIETVFAALN